MKEEIKIKQRHEDCHYETIMWTNYDWQPICCGFGFTQEEADTKCLVGFLRERNFLEQ